MTAFDYQVETKKVFLHKHSIAAGGLNKSHKGLLQASQYVGIRYLMSINLCPFINNFPSLLCFFEIKK